MVERDKLPSLLVKLCSGKAAFEALPQRRIIFSMNMIRQLFEANQNFKILVYTPHIIILRKKKGGEVTFCSDGRMLLKKISNKDEATALAYSVLEIVSEAIRTK